MNYQIYNSLNIEVIIIKDATFNSVFTWLKSYQIVKNYQIILKIRKVTESFVKNKKYFIEFISIKDATFESFVSLDQKSCQIVKSL